MLTRISAFSSRKEVTLRLLLPFHSPAFSWLGILTANSFNSDHNLCLQKNGTLHSLCVFVLKLWHMSALNDFCFLRMSADPADSHIILLFYLDSISFGLYVYLLYTKGYCLLFIKGISLIKTDNKIIHLNKHLMYSST